MMTMKMIQNAIGAFNWANSKQVSLICKIGIFDEAGNVREELQITRDTCLDYYERKYDDMYRRGQICGLYAECVDAARAFAYPDYAKQAKSFMRFFAEHYDELAPSLYADIERIVQSRIRLLQEQLADWQKPWRLPGPEDLLCEIGEET